MSSRSKLLLTAATAAMAVGLGACGGSASGPSGKRDAGYATDGTFTIGITRDPASFDPFTFGLGGLQELAYDSLVNQLPDGEFVSGLAERWDTDEYGGTFTLRPDVTCSDGAPLTAKTVKENIEYVSNPENKSPQYGLNTPTVPITVTADDEARTVTVKYPEKYGFTLHTLGRLPIVCASGLANMKSLITTSAGTGPYVLESLKPGDRATLKLRKDYAWGPDGATAAIEGLPATVVLRLVENESTAANLLLSGELNLARVIGEDRQRLEPQGLEVLKKNTSTDSGAWAHLNQRAGRALSDARVRKALVRALNLDQVVQISTGGNGTRANGLLVLEPAVCTDFDIAPLLPEQDVDEAGRLLDKAGWQMGANGVREKDGSPLSIDLVYSPDAGSPFHRPTVEFLSESWRKVGIDVNVVSPERTKLVEILFTTRDWDVYMTGMSFSLPSQIVRFISGGEDAPLNYAGTDNEEFTRHATKAIESPGEAGCESWYAAEEALVSNVHILPMSRRNDLWWVNGGEVQLSRYEGVVPLSLRVFK